MRETFFDRALEYVSAFVRNGIFIYLPSLLTGYLLTGTWIFHRSYPDSSLWKYSRVELVERVYQTGIFQNADHTLAQFVGSPVDGYQIANLTYLGGIGLSPDQRHFVNTLSAAEDWGPYGALACVMLMIAVLEAISRLRGECRGIPQARELTREIREPNPAPRPLQIQVGKVPLPRKLEPRGILLNGITGAGKSQVINSIIAQARARDESVIVVDRGCEAYPMHSRPGDLILNPLDARSAPLSLLAEVENELDIDTLTSMLWPMLGDSNAGDYFRYCAAQIFKDVLASGQITTNGELWRALSSITALTESIRGTVAEQYSRAKNFGDMYATMLMALPWAKYLPPDIGAQGFSMRRFVREVTREPGRAAFITLPRTYAPTLNPLAAMLVGLACHEILAQPASITRRIWLVTDELGNLPRLGNFSSALTEGRKHGLSTVSGIQSVAQMNEIYGKNGAQIIMSCFTTWLILRAGDADTAEAMSRHVGEKEIREWHESSGTSQSVGDYTSNSSGMSEHVRVKRTALAREIMELPDLHGYLCVGHYSPARVTIPLFKGPPAIANGFVAAKLLQGDQLSAAAPKKNMQPGSVSPVPGRNGSPVEAEELDMSALK